MFRRVRVLLLALVALSAAFVAPAAAANNGSGSRSRSRAATPAWTPPPPRAYVVFDEATGVVVASADEHQTFLPASTVKLMTALTALMKLPLSATVTISARAAAMPAMDIGAKPGQVWTLDQLLHALLIVSGNDAAYAIAEGAGGTAQPTLESNSMIVLFAHVRTGRWASVMPAKLAETLGLTETIRAIPILQPEAVHTIGLVVPAREPMTPLNAALVAEAKRLAQTLDG